MKEQLPNLTDFTEIQQLTYANGTKHVYGVDEAGRKTHISFDDIAEHYGVPANRQDDAETVPQPASADEQNKSYADWHQRTRTAGAKPSKTGMSIDDVRYSMWQDDNGRGVHAGRSLKQRESDDQKREWARFEMRVKTGLASPEETRLYYTHLENATDRAQNPVDEVADRLRSLGQASKQSERSEQPASEAQAPAPEQPSDDTTTATTKQASDVPEQAEAEAATPHQTPENQPEQQDEPAPVPEQPLPAEDTTENGDVPDATDRSQAEQESDELETREARFDDLTELAELRNEYMRLVAGRSRRSLTRAFSNAKVNKARKDYELKRDNLIASEREYLADINVDQELIGQAMAVMAFGEERKMAMSLRDYRLVATGNYQFKDLEKFETGNYEFDEDGQVQVVEKGRLGRQMNKFYEWYGRSNAGVKQSLRHRAAKTAVMLGAGAGVGVASAAAVSLLAPSAAFVAAAGGGAYLANRITKAFMSTHFKRKGDEAQVQHGQARHEGLLRDLGDGTSDIVMGDLVKAQMKREVFRNRRRTAALAAAGLLGGAAAANMIDFDGVRLPFFGGNGPEATDTPDSDRPEARGNGGGDGEGRGTNGNNGENRPDRDDSNNETDFGARAYVESGNGYVDEFQDMFGRQGVTLSDQQSFDLYDHLTETFPGKQGNFFTDNPSYLRSEGDYGISRAGSATWDPAVLAEIDRYARENDLLND